jgi:hypothetical protein
LGVLILKSEIAKHMRSEFILPMKTMLFILHLIFKMGFDEIDASNLPLLFQKTVVVTTSFIGGKGDPYISSSKGII